MDEQLTLFPSDDFDDKLLASLTSYAHKLGYPETSFSIQENISKKGKNKGKVISKTVFLNEESYPFDEHNKISKSTSLILLYPNETMREIKISEDIYLNIPLPKTAIVKKDATPKDKSLRILFATNTTDIFSYISLILEYALEHYDSSNSFGCCSRYDKCSSSKKCIHPNKLYALGCQYRKNLEKGNIFF